MDRNRKREIVSKLREEIDGVNSIFLCNFNGLSVAKDTQLRAKMRENGASYTVIKNTLLKRAFEGTSFAQVDEYLVGNTALAHHGEDIIGLAKLIRDFSKEHETFQFKAGVVEGRVIDLEALEALANLPSREVLISKLMFILNFPVQGLVTGLSGILRKLVVALDQIKQQKEQA